MATAPPALSDPWSISSVYGHNSTNADVGDASGDEGDGRGWSLVTSRRARSTRSNNTSSNGSLEGFSALLNQWGARLQVNSELDNASVVKAQERLMIAIDAEQAREAQDQAESLSGSLQLLENSGNMITGLRLEAQFEQGDMQQIFKAYRPPAEAEGEPRHLPKHNFKPKQNISVMLADYCRELLTETGEGEGLVEDIGNGGGSGESNFARAEPVADAPPGSDETGQRSRPWELPSQGACPRDVANVADVATELARLGLKKSFEAVVLNSDDRTGRTHLKISARYDGAAMQVQDAPDANWVIVSSIDDVTFRRQRAAVNCLGTLLSRRGPEDSQPSVDEVRVRKILLADPKKSADKDFVRESMAKRVSWMDDAALAEVKRVLDLDLGLNALQREHLKAAATGTVTLLKGPPGTGKTLALASMVKAMCRVFLDQGNDGFAKNWGFLLPTLQGIPLWLPNHTMAWLESLLTEEDSVSGPQPDGNRVPGLTSQIKEWLCKGFGAETGCKLKTASLTSMRNIIQGQLQDVHGMDAEEAAEAAQASAPVLQLLREKLEKALTSSSARAMAYKVRNDRQMRIIVAADTNVAIMNVLKYIDNDPNFTNRGYNILLLGKPQADIDERLLTKYGVEYRRASHPLNDAYRSVMKAIADKSLTTDLAEVLREKIRDFANVVSEEAQGPGLSAVVRTQLVDLAEFLRTDVAPRVASLVVDFVQGSQRQQERTLGQLRKEVGKLKETITYHLVVKAQVVLGTNCSVGVLRSWNQHLQLSNPILFVDEAGQSTEPSAMIPFTLGAEWAMLAADLKQLRPTVKTDIAKFELGYYKESGGSVYGRLRELGIPEKMLKTQYRMHSGIREFPSKCFYGNMLQEDPANMPDERIPTPRDVTGQPMMWWPFQREDSQQACPRPVAFMNIQGVDKVNSKGPSGERFSYYNLEEASAVLRLALLMGTDPTVKSIALITPYKAQRNRLQEKLEAGKDFLTFLRGSGTFFPTVNVYSVDGCQGQEADVVIVSTVRSDMNGRHLGIVADPRRLNVAITRAKRALLIVGNAPALKSVPIVSVDKGVGDVVNYWPKWLKWAEDNKCFVVRNQVPLYLQMSLLPKEMCVTKDDEDQLDLMKRSVAHPKFWEWVQRAATRR